MFSTAKFSSPATFRLTVILPWVMAIAIYLFMVASYENVLKDVTEETVNFTLNAVTFLLLTYTTLLSSLMYGWVEKTPLAVRIAVRIVLGLTPLVLAGFCGAIATTRGTTPGPFIHGLILSSALVLPFILTMLTGALLLFFTQSLILKPIWWLMGSPAHKEMSPPIPSTAGMEQAPVQQNADSTEPTAEKYTFDWKTPKAGLDSLAGMTEFKAELASYLKPYREYASGKGAIADTNGILLSGPPGNGKTTIAEVIAGELGLPFVKIGGMDLTSKWVNESPAVIKELFRQALEKPCVLFFDEFDSVAVNRGSSNTHGEDRKVVNSLLASIDSARKSRVVLIAATNYIEQIDSAIARDGRFDYRIEVPFPDQEAREAILRGLLKKFSVNAEDATLHHVAQLWVRRSIAFIESTVKRLRDNGKGIKGGIASVEDFKQASRQASRRASAIPNAGAKLSQIALTADVRRESDSLVYRLRNWEQIAERGGEPPSGVLLYGPPGTGKTNFVRALARELEYWHVFEVNAADVLQDPRKFRDTMDLAANHRPAIVFIDEADELLRDRTHSAAASATNEILKSMDGMMGKIPEIVFMAATNNPEIIDGAALRGGRFAEKIFMGRLTGDDLVAFLEKDFASKTKVQFANDLTPRALAERLGEAAPSDALGLLRKAINYTFGHDGVARSVDMSDIERAIISTQI